MNRQYDLDLSVRGEAIIGKLFQSQFGHAEGKVLSQRCGLWRIICGHGAGAQVMHRGFRSRHHRLILSLCCGGTRRERCRNYYTHSIFVNVLAIRSLHLLGVLAASSLREDRKCFAAILQ
jgi:hypothetical protein